MNVKSFNALSATVLASIDLIAIDCGTPQESADRLIRDSANGESFRTAFVRKGREFVTAALECVNAQLSAGHAAVAAVISETLIDSLRVPCMRHAQPNGWTIGKKKASLFVADFKAKAKAEKTAADGAADGAADEPKPIDSKAEKALALIATNHKAELDKVKAELASALKSVESLRKSLALAESAKGRAERAQAKAEAAQAKAEAAYTALHARVLATKPSGRAAAAAAADRAAAAAAAADRSHEPQSISAAAAA